MSALSSLCHANKSVDFAAIFDVTFFLREIHGLEWSEFCCHSLSLLAFHTFCNLNSSMIWRSNQRHNCKDLDEMYVHSLIESELLCLSQSRGSNQLKSQTVLIISHFRKSCLNQARNCRGLTRRYLQIVESKFSHSMISWISWFLMFWFYGLLESITCESESQTWTRRRNNSWNRLLECASLRQIEFRIRLNSFIHGSMINGDLCRSRNLFNNVS
jgi:hypothetical protein